MSKEKTFAARTHEIIIAAAGPEKCWSKFDYRLMNLAREADDSLYAAARPTRDVIDRLLSTHMQAIAQQAIMAHPFWDTKAVLSYGFAGCALKAVHASLTGEKPA